MMKSKISILIFLLLAAAVFPQNDLRVVSSNLQSLTIEYLPQYTDTSQIKIDRNEFVNIRILFGSYASSLKWGSPAVPERVIPIGVPSEYGNTFEVLETSFIEKPGQVIPIPIPNYENKNLNYEYSIGSDYLNYTESDEILSLGEFGISRGIPIQNIKIKPVKFYPGKNVIKLFTRILFRINFNPSQLVITPMEDDFLRGSLINYQSAKLWNRDSRSFKKKTAVFNSVLAQGKWYKFEAPEEGVYKITRSMLSAYGIDPNSVDPRTIKIYNNGGRIIPERVTADRPADLVENAIMVVGEEDGKFDENDYILFYGRGVNFWEYNSLNRRFERRWNPYSKENFYWITSGGSQGKRIKEKAGRNEAAKYLQNSSAAFVHWDEDKINIGKSGRIFLGDEFSSTMKSRSYTSKLDGRLPGSLVKYNFKFVNASTEFVQVLLEENNVNIYSGSIYGVGKYTYGVQLIGSANYSGELPENRSILKFSFNPLAVNSYGYLDYFEISYERDLKAVNDVLLFYSKDTTAIIEYGLNGFSNSNIRVFDVTDDANVRLVSNPVMWSGGEYRFQMAEQEGKVSKYVAIGADKFNTPKNPVEVPNSNLHGISDGAKFIIITHKNFKDQANRLRDFKANELEVTIPSIVIDVDEIYNEFGCGMKDVTAIRDFIKYAYDNWSIKPEYVLLFGDGDYDYKNIEGNNKNFVPPWETLNSLDALASYPMDDFFVMVDGDDNKVDLAIGRFNVQTSAEAKAVVDKVIAYEKSTDKGLWRNLITLVADDGLTSEGNDWSLHTGQSELLANSYISKSFDLKKIYLSAYPTVITGAGRRKPDVNKAIIDAINEGTVIINYIGHGNPEVWAHEFVFEKSTTIPKLNNQRLPFLTAATCDFGYYDIPTVQSSTELLINKENSGIIAGFTAARAVYSDSNARLNEEFYSNMLNSQRDVFNLPIPIGKAYFRTKYFRTDTNDQKFHLYGDPTLRLALPQYKAAIDSINGNKMGAAQFNSESSLQIDNGSKANSVIQLKALGKVQINGSIRKPDNSIWEDYSGEALLSVFDSERTLYLEDIFYNMNIQGGVIYRGRVSVNAGRFATEFIVPKDISYENKNGKVSAYFFNSGADGIGFTTDVIVGGTDNTNVNDGKGPTIEIFFDDITYESSYLANPNSTLIVKLSDETGLNTTGTGVGHKLEGILNEDENNPIDFTNYFIGDIDAGGKSGSIRYKLSNLDMGDYKLKVKAWDVFNNFSEETINFSLVTGSELVIRDVVNYPNPFSNSTTFTFQQNLNKPLSVKIKIYTIAGRLIKEIETANLQEKFVRVFWDGRDEDGNQLGNGTYLYKLMVKTTDGDFSKSILGKLAVIR